jgi:enediyne biosynthesis protein E4
MQTRTWVLLGVLLAVTAAGGLGWLVFGRPGPGRAPEETRPPAPPPARREEGPTGPPLFRDVTAGSGLHFTYRNGEEADQFTILESLGGGVALLDYDGDGLLDVFVTGGGYFDGPDRNVLKGHPCKLYRNLGNWKFEDVTSSLVFDGPWFYTHGAAVADYDCDGWPDLLVTGYGRVVLFHNEDDGKGGRRLVDVTEKVGLRDDSWSTSAGWADLDGDGYPDLYVCHYVDWSFANNPHCPGQRADAPRDVCPPQRFKPLRHSLFRNEKGEEGGRTFRDVSEEQGFRANGCGLGVVLADLNGDGRPDVYVANDATNNFLFLNRGGKLEEKGLLAGVATGEGGHYDGSMGTDAGDYDGSGRPSLWVTNFQGEPHALYRNLGRERFLHQSRVSGVAAIGLGYVGFGTSFIDVDNDGWEDLVVVNGHVLRYPTLASTFKQRPVLLRNVEQGGRRFFKDVSAQGGPFFATPALGRGLAVGDLDNDGWPDLVVSHGNSPVALLRNEAAAAAAPPARWLGVRLVGKGNRDVVGSTVVCRAGDRTLTRFAKGGGSYLSAGDPRLLFGLGSPGPAGKVTVTVKWSWGQSETWDDLEPNAYWQLQEGQPAAKRLYAVR